MKRALALGLIAGLVGLALPLAARADGPDCEWLAGDFHVHTIYSHDSWGGPGSGDTNTDPFESFPTDPEGFFGDAITLGWTPGQQGTIAESRDLDFIAITDHDNVDAQIDLANSGWGGDTLPGEHPMIWVPDYENTVAGPGGHAQMHGATPEHFDEYEDASVEGPEASAQLIRRDGGAFQINHPADTDWHEYNGDKDGDGAQDYDEFTYAFPGFAPDALEVWNIGAWIYEPPFPATNDHEFPVQMYDELLDQGFHIGATGGSDTHWRSTTAAQGVGQPTTWVCAAERSSDAIVDAVKANRTTISHQPPAHMGGTVKLYADDPAQEGEFESMIGDTVTPGSTVKAVAENAEGATLRLITNGGETLAETTIDSFNYSQTFEVPADATWVRAEAFYADGRDARLELEPLCNMSNQLFGEEPEKRNTYCENRLAMVSMTSPIYFEQAAFDPATTLAYVGDTTVRVNKDATFAATLVDSTGAPLVGQAVTFTFRGVSLSGVTDETGRASVQTRVSNPRGTEVVHVDFAGTDTYDPAHLEQIITITNGRG